MFFKERKRKKKGGKKELYIFLLSAFSARNWITS
jgi:hypothetical protein